MNLGPKLPAMLLGLIWLAAGCVSPVKGLFPALPGQPSPTIYVIHRGLHTGVIVPAADIPPGVWPEHNNFPGAVYLEAGWGDSQGYRFPWTSAIVFRALFDSQASVLLIHAFTNGVSSEYVGIAKQIIAVRLSTRGFARLCGYIHQTYAFNSSGRPVPMPSIYPGEDFFLARGHYSALNNSNNWTAGALRTAGCPVSRRWSLLPGIVMRQTRRFGHVIWPAAPNPETYTLDRFSPAWNMDLFALH